MRFRAESKNLAINPPVFFVSVLALLAFLGAGVFASEQVQDLFPKILAYVTDSFGWLYVLSVTGFIVFVIWLLFSRHATTRLGSDDEEPEFATLSWFAMLFSAGMGIGLVFYGVAEPILHYENPPVGPASAPQTQGLALAVTFFHWGIHAWAIYLVVALGIAYFAFRRKLPLSLRSCFYPLFGERIYGPIGHVIDVIAVFGTLFGLATSLGIGAMQVSAGLNELFGIAHNTQTQLILIGCITLAATISLVTGVGNGIRRLSELNLVLASFLLLFVFLTGPTGFIVDQLVEGVGNYAGLLLERTLRVSGSTPNEKEWMGNWTLFYWGWWISWAPFVGMFVARVSRGRTIRGLILGALLVPTGVTMTWFSVFGGTALWKQAHGGGIVEAVSADASTAIYVLLDTLPFGSVTSLLAATVVTVFFVTSSDSASFVVDMLTSGGHPDPPIWQRVFWASAEGATAATLLYAGGQASLVALQSAVISIGLPFCLCIIVLCYSLARGLNNEEKGLALTGASAPAANAALGRAARASGPEADASASAALVHAEAARQGEANSNEIEPTMKKILVPVDRSQATLRAIGQARTLAMALDAELHFLHVAPRPADYLPLEQWLGSQRGAAVDAHLQQAAGSAMHDFFSEHEEARHLASSVEIRVGEPSRVLSDAAEQGNYALLVMARNSSQEASQRLGTIAERVLRRCSRPVLLVQ